LFFLCCTKKGGAFLEFRAIDGVKLSDICLLESKYEWLGILAEASPQLHKKFKETCPNSNIIKECIYLETGGLDFLFRILVFYQL
jgi:hypothetical protein